MANTDTQFLRNPDGLPYRLGLLDGKVDRVEKDIEQIRADQSRIFDRLEDQSNVLKTIESSTSQLVKFAEETESRVTVVERRCAGSGSGNRPRVVIRAWDRPVGDILFDILIKALYVIGVGAVVAIILYGITATGVAP